MYHNIYIHLDVSRRCSKIWSRMANTTSKPSIYANTLQRAGVSDRILPVVAWHMLFDSHP